MEEKTDKELYYEFLQGNQKRFEEIIIKYKDKLIYFIQKYVKSIDIAEDAFVYILIHKEKYDTHNIGFGYDTKTNSSGTGIQNNGLKMSMFDITDLNNPKELFNVKFL